MKVQLVAGLVNINRVVYLLFLSGSYTFCGCLLISGCYEYGIISEMSARQLL